MFKIILLSLMFATNLSYAQGAGSDPSPKSATHENHTEDDVEALVNEIEAQKKKQAEMALAIEKSQEDFKNVGNGTLAEIQKTGKISLEHMKNMDDATLKFLQNYLSQGHMAKLPEEQVRAMIMGQVKGKPVEAIFTKFPILLDMYVDYVRDPKAMPGLLQILRKKDVLKLFAYIWIGLFVLSLLIKFFMFPKKWTGFKRLSASIALNFGFLTISFGLFYFMFKQEITPLLNIISKRIF